MKTSPRTPFEPTAVRRPWAGSCELAYVSDDVFDALIDGATRLEERLDQERARQTAGTAPQSESPRSAGPGHTADALRAPAAPLTAWYFDALEFAPPAAVRSNASMHADEETFE